MSTANSAKIGPEIRWKEVLRNDFGRKDSLPEKEKGMVSGRTGGEAGYIKAVGFKMGVGSFPNKGILRNNLCLPACRILMYKRMTLEI